MASDMMFVRQLAEKLNKALTDTLSGQISPEYFEDVIKQTLDQARELQDHYTGIDEGLHELYSSFYKCSSIVIQRSPYLALKCVYQGLQFECKFLADLNPQLTHASFSQVTDEYWRAIFKKCHSDGDDLRDILRLSSNISEQCDQARQQEKYMLCYLLAADLWKVYTCLVVLHILTPKCLKSRLIMCVNHCARCLHRLNVDAPAINHCHFVLEQLCDYDDFQALETWAMILYRQKKLQVSRTKAEDSLKYAKTDADKERLQLLIQKIGEEITNRTKPQSLKPDSEWLTGSNIQVPQNQKKHAEEVKSMHVKKPRRQRRMRVDSQNKQQNTGNQTNVQSSVLSSLLSRSSIQTHQRSAIERHIAENKSVPEKQPDSDEDISDIHEFEPVTISNWHSLYKSDFNQYDDSFTSTDIISIEDDQDLCQDTTSIKTFFEESIKAYDEHGQLKHATIDQLMHDGLELDEKYIEDMASKTKKHSEFYTESLSKDKLKDVLRNNPRIYKHCSLKIKTCHSAVCTSLKPDLDCGPTDIQISGRSMCGQAFNDDEVVVEIIDKGQTTDSNVYGKVIGTLKRHCFEGVEHPVLVCMMDDFDVGKSVKPLCKTIPKVHLLAKTKQQTRNIYRVDVYEITSEGKLKHRKVVPINPAKIHDYVFLVVYLYWKTWSHYPQGAIVEIVQSETSIEQGMNILALQHNVPRLYNFRTVQCFQAEYGLERLQENIQKKTDAAVTAVFTIDPPGSKDLDDAFSINKNSDGTFEVRVHIADVASVIQKDDYVDAEAKKRATTFYAGNMKPRHMLPEPLSENYCSLLPGENRLALSVVFQMKSDGKLVQKCNIMRSVVRSTKQFTYSDVQTIIDTEKISCEHASDIRQLHLLAKELRYKRLKDRSFALPTEKVFQSDESTLQTLDAHYLVEEFMILANREVAKFVLKSFPECVPLRCQKPPAEEKKQQWIRNHNNFADFVMNLQERQVYEHIIHVDNAPDLGKKCLVVVDDKEWKTMEQALKQNKMEEVRRFFLTDELHPLQYVTYNDWIAMQESAKYVASCNSSKDDQKHYQLELYPYVHFTSPIRRFSDLVVQRLIHAALAHKPPPYSPQEILNICLHVTNASARAKSYQKGCRFLLMGQMFAKQPRKLDAFVADVSDSGAQLCIPSLGDSLPDSCQKLPFNLLNLNSKPDIITDSDKDFVTIKWRKRLYDHSGVSMMPQKKGSEARRLDPYSKAVFVLHSEWKMALQKVIKGDYKELKRIISKVNLETNRDRVPQCTDTMKDVSSEGNDGKIATHLSHYSLSLTKGQTVTIQMHADTVKGLSMPVVGLFDVTKNFKCCLIHVDNPVKYLARYSTLQTKDTYDSKKDYLERWFPLIKMEAATCAACNEEGAMVNGISVTFKGRTGSFSLLTSFCNERSIDFGTLNVSISKDEETQKSSKGENDRGSSLPAAGYLCLRTVKDTMVWIAHAELKTVRKRNSKTDVSFELHPSSSLPPFELMNSNIIGCCVELLPIPEVDRRTIAFLGSTEVPWSNLAEAIALGKQIPKLDDFHRRLGDKIDKDIGKLGNPPIPQNNIAQHRAIEMALTSSFSLIQGPPGTGKTYTGLKLIYLFNKVNNILREQGHTKYQVLYCGPSNKSVDLVTKLIRRRLDEHCPKIIRMYGKSIENRDYPIPGMAFLSKRSIRNAQTDECLQDISVHHVIRKKDKPYAKEINTFDAKFRKNPEMVEQDKIKEYISLVRKATVEELQHYDVIFCTTAVACNPKLVMGTKNKIFQCIIDESAMCTEPQTLAPIIATNAKQVVLIGDHKQLQPVIMCREAGYLGLSKSLFERYAGKSRFLSIQYRMNPMICDFPSKTFYEGKLETHPSMAWKDEFPLLLWPRPRKNVWIPHFFCHVEGEEETLTVTTEEGNEQSKSNQKEIEFTIKIFQRIVEEIMDPNYINIISQYNAQCHGLKERLKAEKYVKFNVNTVVSSQGGEWDYVIFSTVRSLPRYKIERKPTQGWARQNLGFITDPHQINVALTRARKGIIIIGNKNLLQCNDVWKRLIESYERDNCVIDCSEEPCSFPPPLAKSRRRQRIRQNNRQYKQ